MFKPCMFWLWQAMTVCSPGKKKFACLWHLPKNENKKHSESSPSPIIQEAYSVVCGMEVRMHHFCLILCYAFMKSRHSMVALAVAVLAD